MQISPTEQFFVVEVYKYMQISGRYQSIKENGTLLQQKVNFSAFYWNLFIYFFLYVKKDENINIVWLISDEIKQCYVILLLQEWRGLTRQRSWKQAHCQVVLRQRRSFHPVTGSRTSLYKNPQHISWIKMVMCTVQEIAARRICCIMYQETLTR